MNNPRFVAEVSSNHHQDLKRCFNFVDIAADIGCDAVKFQLFKINKLFAPEILENSLPHLERKQWELPVSFLPKIAEYCVKRNISFSCTPFYLEAVEELLPFVDFYKIASYELLRNDLISACGKTGKPVVLSTGMAAIDEIKNAVKVLIVSNCKDITLLHCVSGYPTPVSQCNLAVIKTLMNEFGELQSKIRFRFGWSDHSVSPGVIYRAVHHWNAEMIEFHLDIEGQGEEYKAGHCWLPEQIEPVIKNIKIGLEADGKPEKMLQPSESYDRDWRADPSDGLRPMLKIRAEWKNKH